jgi:hypothetical protein
MAGVPNPERAADEAAARVTAADTLSSAINTSKAVDAFNFTSTAGELDDALKNDDALLMEEGIKRFVLIRGEKILFHDCVSQNKLSKESMDSLYARPLLINDDGEVVLVRGRPISRPTISSLILRSPHRTVVDGLAWSPGDGHLVERNGKQLFNTYRPLSMSITPVAGDVSVWTDMAKHVWGEHWLLVTQFFAFTLQFPGTKIKWQVLVMGPRRTGKTALVVPIDQLMGTTSVIVSPEDSSAKWGDQFYQKKLTIYEEVWQPGNYAFFNSIKGMLANEGWQTLNLKGKGIVEQVNVQSLYMCTNHEDALAFTKDEAKLLVVKGPDERLPDQVYADYFATVKTPRFQQALYHYLLNVDVSAFSYGKLPVTTQAALDMSEASEGSFETEMQDRHHLGDPPFNRLLFSAHDVKMMGDRRQPDKTSSTRINRKLAEFGYTRVIVKGPKRGNVQLSPMNFWTMDTKVVEMTPLERHALLEKFVKHA